MARRTSRGRPYSLNLLRPSDGPLLRSDNQSGTTMGPQNRVILDDDGS